MANPHLENFIKGEVITVITTHLAAVTAGKRVRIQHKCSAGQWVNSSSSVSSSGSPGASIATIEFDVDGSAEVDTEDFPTGGNFENRVATYNVTGRFKCDAQVVVSGSGLFNMSVTNQQITGLNFSATVHKAAHFPTFIKKKSEDMLKGLHKAIGGRIKSRGRHEVRSLPPAKAKSLL